MIWLPNVTLMGEDALNQVYQFLHFALCYAIILYLCIPESVVSRFSAEAEYEALACEITWLNGILHYLQMPFY